MLLHGGRSLSTLPTRLRADSTFSQGRLKQVCISRRKHAHALRDSILGTNCATGNPFRATQLRVSATSTAIPVFIRMQCMRRWLCELILPRHLKNLSWTGKLTVHIKRVRGKASASHGGSVGR